MQKGFSALSSKNKNSSTLPLLNDDSPFLGTYQNAYDVLGIADDARLFTQAEGSLNSGGNLSIEEMLNVLQ